MRVFRVGVAALAVSMLACGVAQATIHNFVDFPIDGAQVPFATPGSGTGTVTYDDVTNEMNWNISYSGLLGSVTAAHFHGPADYGQNAGVQVGIGTANPAIGMATLTETQETQLLSGLWYVNIHSSAAPGGEIRGQVVPEPASLALLAAGGLALVRRRR